MTNAHNSPDPLSNPFPTPTGSSDAFYGDGQPYNTDGYSSQPTSYQTPINYSTTPGMHDLNYGSVPVEQTYAQPGLIPQYGFAPGVMEPTKDKTIAVLLWFFFGFISAHNLYTGFNAIAITQICLFFFGTVLTGTIFLSIIGLPMLFVGFVWWLIDAVQMITDGGRFRYSFRR